MFIPFSHLMNNKGSRSYFRKYGTGGIHFACTKNAPPLYKTGGGNKLYFVASYRLAVFHKKDGKNFK